MRRTLTHRLTAALLLAPLWLGCGDGAAPEDNLPTDEVPPDPPICTTMPAVTTEVGTCKGPSGDPLPCDEAHRFCKEKYAIAHEAGMTRVELRGNHRPLGWDVGYPLTLSADGKTLYVTSEVASLVHVIDVASAKVVKNIKVGKRPRRMAITPDGKELWVTNELGSSVSIVSTADHSVIGEIKFAVKGARAEDISPVGITMTKDGKRAFVALGKATHVAFVDVATRKVTDLVLVGKRPWNVTLGIVSHSKSIVSHSLTVT